MSFSQSGGSCNAGDDFYEPLCNPAIINLNDYLSSDADSGGIWACQNSGCGLTILSDGTVDLSSKNQQTSSFTYSVTSSDGSCEDTAFISFEIDRISPGENVVIDVCEGQAEFMDTNDLLINVLQDASTGGTWVSEVIDDGDLKVISYTYTIEPQYGCPEQSATVTVQESQSLNAGDPEIGHFECNPFTEINLDDFLPPNANKGGEYSIKANDGKPIKLRKPRTIDFGGLGAGNFTFKFGYAISDCGTGNISETEITIEVDIPENPGVDSTLDICRGETVTEQMRFEALIGETDEFGFWEQSTEDPLIWSYFYGNADCRNTATLTITEKSIVEDGTLQIQSGSTVTAEQLLVAIGGTSDLNGSWTPAPGGPDTYTYTLPTTSECPGQTANVIVTESTLSVDDFIRSKIKVYPNPFSKTIKLKGEIMNEITSIEIYSIHGQLLKKIINSFSEVNISNLNSSIYILKVNTNLGSGTIKLLKQ